MSRLLGLDHQARYGLVPRLRGSRRRSERYAGISAAARLAAEAGSARAKKTAKKAVFPKIFVSTVKPRGERLGRPVARGWYCSSTSPPITFLYLKVTLSNRLASYAFCRVSHFKRGKFSIELDSLLNHRF